MNSNNMGKPPATPALPSVYSLTFDELQSTLGGPGRDFGSMNMDELLRSIWTAEETYAMASVMADGAHGQSSTAAPAGTIQRQGSLTLPRTLSQKTVDEVWRDVVPQRQQTLGEVTLEEFLVRAGVVREEPPTPLNNNNNIVFGGTSNNNNPGLAFGDMAAVTRNYPVLGGNVDIGMGNGLLSNGMVQGMLGLGGGGGVSVAMGSPNGLGKDLLGKGNGDLSSLSPVPFSFGTATRGRKCTVEKVVERRKRRMIKNRESAARSRARKQAYTMELEAEVAKLKEQNEELQKKQEEILEIQKNQIMEMVNQQCGPKKLCLRRTYTGPW